MHWLSSDRHTLWSPLSGAGQRCCDRLESFGLRVELKHAYRMLPLNMPNLPAASVKFGGAAGSSDAKYSHWTASRIAKMPRRIGPAITYRHIALCSISPLDTSSISRAAVWQVLMSLSCSGMHFGCACGLHSILMYFTSTVQLST